MIKNKTELITEQELYDRDICTRMITKLLNRNYSIVEVKNLEVQSPVDLWIVVKNNETSEIQNVLVEVKTRNKDARQLREYPWAELKCEKVRDILNVQKQIPNSSIFYAVILNHSEFYLYDLLNIDYSHVNIVDWRVKKTEFDSYSPYKVYKTFQLPWNLAVEHANIKKTLEGHTPPLF